MPCSKHGIHIGFDQKMHEKDASHKDMGAATEMEDGNLSLCILIRSLCEDEKTLHFCKVYYK